MTHRLPSTGLLQCVLVAAVLLLAGASLAFAGMAAAARCDADEGARHGRGP